MTFQNHYAPGEDPLSRGNVENHVDAPGSNSDYAQNYAQRGNEVFPIVPGTKAPYLGSHGFHDATSSSESVRRAWAENPDAGIGILPHSSALVVVDFDDRHGGQHVLTFLREHLGEEALNTNAVKTHDGLHLYYLDAESVLLPKLLLVGNQGADVFGAHDGMKRGYVVAPPSIHPDGGQYEWQSGHAPWEHQPLPITAQIILALNEYAAQNPNLAGESAHESAHESTHESTGEGHSDNLYSLDTTRYNQVSLEEAEDDDDDDSLRQYDKYQRFVKAVCDKLGVPFRPGEAFHSPLRKDDHPSAVIIKRPDGYYRYHDFTQSGRYYAMVQVYGAWVTGQNQPLPKLTSVGYATWQTRLLLELGWIKEPQPISIPPLPADAPIPAREAYKGFRLLLICRAVKYGGVAPAPYTHSFAEQWCGISMSAATSGIAWLKRKGFLKRVKTVPQKGGHQVSLYVPANYPGPGVK